MGIRYWVLGRRTVHRGDAESAETPAWSASVLASRYWVFGIGYWVLGQRAGPRGDAEREHAGGRASPRSGTVQKVFTRLTKYQIPNTQYPIPSPQSTAESPVTTVSHAILPGKAIGRPFQPDFRARDCSAHTTISRDNDRRCAFAYPSNPFAIAIERPHRSAGMRLAGTLALHWRNLLEGERPREPHAPGVS